VMEVGHMCENYNGMFCYSIKSNPSGTQSDNHTFPKAGRGLGTPRDVSSMTSQ
jgi:hypothetical protein